MPGAHAHLFAAAGFAHRLGAGRAVAKHPVRGTLIACMAHIVPIVS